MSSPTPVGSAPTTAALLAASLAAFAAPAAAQQAYFSATGEFTTAGGNHDFTYGQIPRATTADDLRFTTHAASGGTNAAGDLIADGPIDSVLDLRNSGGTPVASNDDGGFNLDSLLSWPGVAVSGGTLPAGGLPGDDYILRVRDLGNNSAGPWSVDLEAPASLISLSTNQGFNSRLDSLKFGTNDDSPTSAPAFWNLARFDGTSTTLADELVVAQTGRGRLDLRNGVLNVNGEATVRRGGSVVVSGFEGVFNANGGLLLEGGTLDVNDRGTLNSDGFLSDVGGGPGSGTATVTVTGSGASWDSDDNFLRIAPDGSRGTVRLINNASATFKTILVGQNAATTSTSGLLDIGSGADVAAVTLFVGREAGAIGSGTVNVGGAGSTLTLTGSDKLVLGNGTGTATGGRYAVNVNAGGTLTTGSGGVDIHSNGRLSVRGNGNLNVNGNVDVDGGRFEVANDSFQNIWTGDTLSARNDGQVETSGTWFLYRGRSVTLASGADLRHDGFLAVGTVNGAGTVMATGSGTSLEAGDGDLGISVGQGSGTGIVALRSGATLAADRLDLNPFGTASSNAFVEVLSGSAATIDGAINVGVFNGMEDYDGVGRLRVSGTGSSLTQTAGGLHIGNPDPDADGGDHRVFVASGGTYTTSTDATVIRKTGTLTVNGGTFNANGDVDLIGGTIDTLAFGFELADGRQLTASDGAEFAVDGHYSLGGGTNFLVRTGSELATTSFLDIGTGGDGTHTVEGPGTRVLTNLTAGVPSDWGREGHEAQVTIRDGATWDIGDDALLRLSADESGSTDDRSTLNIASGAVFTANSVEVATLGMGTATVNVDGSDSRFVQRPGSTLQIGGDAAGSSSVGTVNVRNSGVFDAGNGTATIGRNGTLRLTDGRFTTAGQLVNRGTIEMDAAGGGDRVLTDGFTNEGTLRVIGDSRNLVVVGGGFTQTGDGVLELGRVPNDRFLEGVILESDNAEIAGTLRFDAASDLAGQDPVGTAYLQLLDVQNDDFTGTLTGTFDRVENHRFGDGTALAVTYRASAVDATRAFIGDANLDGDVDVIEIFGGGGDAQILTRNLGTASGATWVDGDFSGDGDVDVIEIFTGNGDAQLLTQNLGAGAGVGAGARSALASAFATESLFASPAEASATYDPSTGEVVLTVGEGLGVVGLGSRSGSLLGSSALAFAEADATRLALFDATGVEAGTFDLGGVVRVGTAASDLALGFTAIGGATTTVGLTVVPEPASLTLLGLGGVTLLRRRRS